MLARTGRSGGGLHDSSDPPIWFADSLACVVARGNLLAASVHGRYSTQTWLAAVIFAFWSALAVVFYWGAP